MAEVKTQKIILKRSSIAGKIPTADQLDPGELAINLADGLLTSKDTSDNIIDLNSFDRKLSGYSNDGTIKGEITSKDSIKTALSKIENNIIDDEKVTSESLNDLNSSKVDKSSVSSSNPTLSFGGTSKIGSVDGKDFKVTMPANPNTDTKVTSAANHYSPTSVTYTPTVGSAVTWGGAVVTGITKDDKGHIVGVTTGTIPGSPSSTTYTFTGGTNSFQVTPSGGSAQVVAVTPSVSNLSTARTISLTGAVTGSVSTNFSANASIATTLAGFDASKITSGTISIDRLPKGALERLSIVANTAARLALTTATVQNGDTVKQTDTGVMYYVKDDTKLSTEAGWEPYTAGTATSVPWSGVTGKPSTFTPADHTHTKSQITDFPTTWSWNNISDKPSSYTPAAHTQAYTTLTGSTTTANQAIVSNGTANGWTLKTLGSNAFNSTAIPTTYAGSSSAGGAATSANKVNTNLVLKVNSGTTEGTNLYTFNGSAAKTLDIKAGSNVSLSATAGVLTISSTNTTYPVATSSANGLMSSTDKSKLDGIATGANNYSLPTATGSVLGGVKTGSNITNSSGTISLTKANVVAALGYTPPTADSNTTYTFANGTNGFTVTPSGGSAQTVTVTPSIANNVTGSGTSGYIAKFSGANTVTNGPALGSSTTTFLRNDGTWASVTVTKLSSPDGSKVLEVTNNGTTLSGYLTVSDRVNSVNGFFQTSDKRLKENIVDLESSLDKISKIPTVNFNYISDEDKRAQIGTIADEVEEVFPELVSKGSDGYKTVDYSKFSIIALSAIKELSKKVDELSKKVNGL
jgi:hypothetical protein